MANRATTMEVEALKEIDEEFDKTKPATLVSDLEEKKEQERLRKGREALITFIENGIALESE